MGMLLFDEQPIVLSKGLAKLVGLNESIVLQQIHYWIEINKKANKNFHKGRYWTYNTFPKWQEEYFSFWGIATVKRIFAHLVSSNLLIVDRFNEDPRNTTNWYTINYDELEKLTKNNKNIPSYQIDTTEESYENIQEESDFSVVSNCDYPSYQNDTSENIKMIRCIKTENNLTEINNTEINKNPNNVVDTLNTSEENTIEYQGMELTKNTYQELLRFIEIARTFRVSKQSIIDWYKNKLENNWVYKGEKIKDREKLLKNYCSAISKNNSIFENSNKIKLPDYYNNVGQDEYISLSEEQINDLKHQLATA